MLPGGFIQRLASIAGDDVAGRFAEACFQEAPVSVRLNPFKQPDRPPDILEGSSPVPWNKFGRFLKTRPVFTLDPLFHAGAYYVQDSSAMFVGHVFRDLVSRVRTRGPLRVLDLCAAPGGKTTDLAASLRELCGDDFLLVSNEVVSKRASVLSDNVAAWGDPCVMVTSADPARFASFEAFFDVILADVPCSGEGMFRKDARSCDEWSPELVPLCAARQKRILSDVWPALKKDGLLLYSTCTFEPEENDLLFGWALSSLGAEHLGIGIPDGALATAYGALFVPGTAKGEGQYVAAALKTGGEGVSRVGESQLQSLRPLRSEPQKGVWKGKDFVPDADWALSLKYERGSWPEAELDLQTALAYLHKDAIKVPDAPPGFVAVTYEGLPLGFVKNLGKRTNNLFPSSRRIIMDINR